jgi:hypothetical protein
MARLCGSGKPAGFGLAARPGVRGRGLLHFGKPAIIQQDVTDENV